MNKRAVFFTGAIAVLVAVAPATDAKVGTGVGAAPIVLTAPAKPASTYELPSLWVLNTGDERAVYRVAVTSSASRGKVASPVPRSWVMIRQDGFELAPGDGTWVPLQLRVPRDAVGGRYEADLVAGTVRQNMGGAGLGAAAATKLQFRVTAPGGPNGRESRSASNTAEGGLAVAALAVVIVAAQRRRRRAQAVQTPRQTIGTR